MNFDASQPLFYDEAFFDRQMAGSLASSQIVLRAVFDLQPIHSVVDVGCGVAPWLRTAQDLGVAGGLGLDGDYVDRAGLLVDPECFRACDLETENLRDATSGSLPFDLAVCVEVAEHLSPARAASFIGELCSLSDLVLFSAAIPGQGGVNHINEQWPEYWSRLFANSGFSCFDNLRQQLWHHQDCDWWYLQNVLIFARCGGAAFDRFSQIQSPVANPMPLVHPRNLQQQVGSLHEVIAELDQKSRYQPFGRDEGIRSLEAKVDRLRGIALEKDAEIESLRQSAVAMRASTSWRVTAPLRHLMNALRR